MEGGGAYNRGAAVQAAHAGSVLQLLEAAARRVPLDATGAPLVIADYGCSQGGNSLAPMRVAIKSLRQGAGPDRPICVVHNDQPGNDFASLFRLLEDDPVSYQRDEVNVFASAVGRSFYKRVLPPGSVALGWSSNSVHWLSRLPEPVPDTWHAASTEIGHIRDAYARQSAEDWRQFLTYRGEELRAGGRLVVSHMAISDDGTHAWEPMIRQLHAQRNAMLANGMISVDEDARMVVPTLGRSRNDLLAPFDADGRFAGLVVEYLDVVLAPDPIWEEFQRSGDTAAFGARWATTARVTLAPSLAAALDPKLRAAFLDRLEAGLAARFTAEPEPMLVWFGSIVLAKED
jgi:hypothetical protein